MGEWSKKIGEYGENAIENFFSIIGWKDLIKGFDIPCLNEDHKNKEGNNRKTHGIDFAYSYMSKLISGQLNNILISAKYKTVKYPNNPNAKFKEYFDDLTTALECYDMSQMKLETVNGFEYSSTKDIGVLVWLNNSSDGNDDLISSIANTRISENNKNCSVYVVDNKRVAFILEVMKYVKTMSDKYSYSFYYQTTGKNVNPTVRESDGKILPVEFINSSILPIKLVNKDNDKEKCLIIATIENFEEDDLLRLIGLASDISTNLVGEVIIAFPDYDELHHKSVVNRTKQIFQNSEFTQIVKVVNYLNPNIS